MHMQTRDKVFALREYHRGVVAGMTDLSEMNLSGLDFTGEDLGCSMYNFSILDDTKFQNCDLSYSKFFATEAISAVFAGANLSEAVFIRADLRDADFRGCNLTNTTFSECHADGALFDPPPQALAGSDEAAEFPAQVDLATAMARMRALNTPR